MQVSQFIDNTISENEARIQYLTSQNKLLEEKKSRGTTGMQEWIDYSFESSSGLTEEFAQFARDFKKELTKMVNLEWELVNWSRGHFEVSGFLKNRSTEKYIYFSTSDVRHFQNEWYENILIRTAKHDKDYTGGRNCFTTWENLPEDIKSL